MNPPTNFSIDKLNANEQQINFAVSYVRLYKATHGVFLDNPFMFKLNLGWCTCTLTIMIIIIGIKLLYEVDIMISSLSQQLQ